MTGSNLNVTRDLFKNFFIILNWSGMNMSTISKSIFLTYIRRLYALVVLFFMSIYTILFTESWITEQYWDSIRVTKLSMSVWLVECTGVYVFLLYWQVKDRFAKHTQMLCEATNYAGTVRYKRNLSIMTSVMFMICIICDIFLFGVNVEFQLRINPKTDSIIKEIFLKRIYGKIFLCLTYSYTLLAYTMTSAIFIFFCTINVVEFFHLNNQLKEEKVLTASILNTYFTKHTKLVCAVDQLDSIFCFYIFFQMCGVIPIIILYIYGFFTGLFQVDVNSTPWLVVMPAMVLIFTLGPAAINLAGSEMVEIVYQKTEFYELDKMSEVYQTISWFSQRCTSKPVGITIGKFFLITNSFLLSAISLIITYVTLLLETATIINNPLLFAKNETM